jgi:predicted ABC-type ATPase
MVEEIRRRFESGLRNFNRVYKRLVDTWAVYDNSGPAPRLVAVGGAL